VGHPGGVCKGVAEMRVDGERRAGNLVAPAAAGATVKVGVTLGAPGEEEAGG
jgi:hypothetical protein